MNEKVKNEDGEARFCLDEVHLPDQTHVLVGRWW